MGQHGMGQDSSISKIVETAVEDSDRNYHKALRLLTEEEKKRIDGSIDLTEAAAAFVIDGGVIPTILSARDMFKNVGKNISEKDIKRIKMTLDMFLKDLSVRHQGAGE